MADSSRTWEVINAGGISYASYRVALVVKELAAYAPDLFVVYSGHNEFLERRTYSDTLDEPEPSRDSRSSPVAVASRARPEGASRRPARRPGRRPHSASGGG